jgi:hypothetical protein
MNEGGRRARWLRIPSFEVTCLWSKTWNSEFAATLLDRNEGELLDMFWPCVSWRRYLYSYIRNRYSRRQRSLCTNTWSRYYLRELYMFYEKAVIFSTRLQFSQSNVGSCCDRHQDDSSTVQATKNWTEHWHIGAIIVTRRRTFRYLQTPPHPPPLPTNNKQQTTNLTWDREVLRKQRWARRVAYWHAQCIFARLSPDVHLEASTRQRRRFETEAFDSTPKL